MLSGNIRKNTTKCLYAVPSNVALMASFSVHRRVKPYLLFPRGSQVQMILILLKKKKKGVNVNTAVIASQTHRLVKRELGSEGLSKILKARLQRMVFMEGSET